MFGVPADAFVVLLVVQMLVFMSTKNFVSLVAGPVLYAVLRVVTAKDARSLRYWLLAARLSGGRTHRLWRSASYAPAPFRRGRSE
jgi:type IV secretory pathway VirB3-like protein